MVACVAQHRADCSDVYACRTRYFACFHLCFCEHSPEASFRLVQRSRSLVKRFRKFSFLERLVFSKCRMRDLLTDGERRLWASLPASPHIDALVLGNPYGQSLCIRRRGQRLPGLPETNHRLLSDIFGILRRREEISGDMLCLQSQDWRQTCKLCVLHTPL